MSLMKPMTKKDFRVEWFSGTGGGGQHRNKHQNCCRIIHIESGLKAQETRFKERSQNQKSAFKRLVSLMLAHEEVEKERRGTVERVRTYHEPRNEVLDHLSGERISYKEAFSKGIGPLIEARRASKV